MKILFVASELTPLAKVGGLGDVVGSLPKELKKLGQDIRIAIPYYQPIKDSGFKTKLLFKGIPIKLSPTGEKINLYQGEISSSKVIVYLLENKKFLSQGGIYFSKSAFCDTLGEIQRFLFFSQAVLEIFSYIDWQPDILHCHDWHTAVIPLLIKVRKEKIKTLLTIHNLANQGIWGAKEILSFLGLKENDWPTLKEQPIGPYGKDINLLQQGILNADLINTVSPTYAQEILTKEFGKNLENFLRKRKNDLYGILNGIDREYFNPQTDKEIKIRSSWQNLERKKENKIDLQETVGLPLDKEMLLLSFIGRLTFQKGVDLIYSAIDEIMREKVQLVILGKGSQKYEKLVREMADKYPFSVSAQIKFDPKLARKIYAGSDLLLMPSRFEPCGLCQLIAFRYGTLPLVRSTGGLKDTVIEGETGFTFENYDPQDFLKSFKKAVRIFYQEKEKWKKMQIRAMKADFSWSKSAQKYLELYQKLFNN